MALQGTSLAKFWLNGLRSCKVQALQDFGWVGYSLARCKPCKMLVEWVTVVQGASLAYRRFLKSDRGGSYFTLKKYFPKLFLHKNIFFSFFLLQKLVTFRAHKFKKKFCAKTILENIFLEKQMFLNFLFQKMFNFFSKKTNFKKKQKKIFWNFCPKKVFLA
jgi:hypothetical protein